jgi:hypothetical protein
VKDIKETTDSLEPTEPTATQEIQSPQASGEEDKRRYLRRKKFYWTFGSSFVTLAVVIGALFYFGILHLPGQKPLPIVAGDLFPGGGDADDGALPGLSEEELLARMQKLADENYFSFSINARPIFENGRAKGNLQIENPSNNVYPMVVEIYLDNPEKELIFNSGGILPDQHIQSAQLLTNLRAGTHKATAYLHLYDPETNIWAGKELVALEITVLH